MIKLPSREALLLFLQGTEFFIKLPANTIYLRRIVMASFLSNMDVAIGQADKETNYADDHDNVWSKN